MNIKDLQTGKIKLEFGNQKQIACIDMHAEEMRLQKLEEDDSVLKEYEIEYIVSGSAIITVKAFNEDEARDGGDDIVGWEDIEDTEWEIEHIRLLGKAE